MPALAVEHAHVRPEEFVRRASEEIAIERSHINRRMRRVMDGIDERQRTCLMRQANNLFDGIDRPDRVRRVARSDELRLRRDLPLQIVQIERAVNLANVRLTNEDAFFLECPPGCDVRSEEHTSELQSRP